jgi:predicted Ser/Thr protein kinase
MFEPGSQIGRYEIQRRLGRGGMGTVYAAHDSILGRLVAIKVFAGDLDIPDARERFVREARSAAALTHPHIVAVHDFGDHESQPYIVMEYVKGETLAELIRRKAPVSQTDKLRWMEELASAAGYAHKMSVIHRDIKPANLMIDKSNRLKVLDFGIARMLGTVSNTRDTIGTPGYMAPEQILGEEVDGRADLFSIGVVFYELLAYTEAFPGDTGPAITHRILHKDPVPLPRLVPDLNPEIQPIIERALKKNVDERFPDAEAFRVAVSRVRKRFEDDSAQVIAPTVLIRETPAPTRKSSGPAIGRRPTTDAVGVATPPPTDRDALARRRLAQLEAALVQGRTLLAAGDLEMALDFCQQALTFDEHHTGALELEQQIATAIAARQAAEEEDATAAPAEEEELDSESQPASAGAFYAPTVLAPSRKTSPVAPAALPEDATVEADDETVAEESPYAPTVLAPSARAPQPVAPPQESVEPPRARKTQAPKTQAPKAQVRKTQAPKAPPKPQRPPGPSLLARMRTAGAAALQRSSIAAAATGAFLRNSAAAVGERSRAIVPTWRPTRAVTRRQQMVWAGAALGVVLVAALAIVGMQIMATPPPGTLVIDAVPWGTVAAIANERGASVALPASASTPLSLVVPSGTYQVTVTGPPPESQTQRITVRVEANGASVAPLVRFQAITPEDYFQQVLTASAPPAEPAPPADTAAAPAPQAPAQPAAAQPATTQPAAAQSAAPAAGANP